MGRPPCCDKIGVKKGPWTPEEDIILVSYIQEHGPGNWRAVPTNTGLARCSKSCRLRWTNYLRPGIKRGNFTEDEEKMIIHLQALLGNRWAAIASYLPQRTDNDIKNYWNTHLQKKLKKIQGGNTHDDDNENNQKGKSHSISKGQWERRLQTDIHLAKKALCEALSLDKKPTNNNNNVVVVSTNHVVNNPSPCPSLTTTSDDLSVGQTSTTTYASSAENISKLLQNWMKNSPKSSQTNSASTTSQSSFNNLSSIGAVSSSSPSEVTMSATTPSEGLDSFFSFNNSSYDSENISAGNFFQDESKNNLQNFKGEIGISQNLETQVPLTLLEKWLFDDTNPQTQEEMMAIGVGMDWP